MRRKICIIAVLVLVLAMLYGCASRKEEGYPGEENYIPSEDSAGQKDGEATAAPSESGAPGTNILVPGVDTDRKLVYTVDFYLETDAFSADYQKLMADVRAAKGYVSRENTYGTEPAEYGDAGRTSSLGIRIPVERLEAFLAQVEGSGNVVKKNMNVADNTDSYYDLENRIDMLETQYEKLDGYLQSATAMEDIITLESRMSEILYQLDGLKGTLRGLEDDVSYATVNITLQELVKSGSVVVKKESLGERIKEGFDSSIKAIGVFLEEALVFLVAAAPVLVLLAVVGLVVVILIKTVQRSGERRLKKQGEKEDR